MNRTLGFSRYLNSVNHQKNNLKTLYDVSGEGTVRVQKEVLIMTVSFLFGLSRLVLPIF